VFSAGRGLAGERALGGATHVDAARGVDRDVEDALARRRPELPRPEDVPLAIELAHEGVTLAERRLVGEPARDDASDDDVAVRVDRHRLGEVEPRRAELSHPLGDARPIARLRARHADDLAPLALGPGR